ncbi:hypothetical protein BABINDRAFT_161941 [Babjeviella inositovora NRRL Y-12698]|uniref:Pre-rRNA-processing protein IPI3 n=1 Tax=Babjeviella inositovora NRRL Y-12698 TaxID=984486 RepID=A0A1E3QPE0_9ASCO|nr:uncharacterized protein BABINDRAFT_161941 [Babjeviella inositovora NRRL Y-12698]ODQ79555.1 hypothetical protein BABINDRAFT_161941 [Babjeviella inositovora NRRL Y-12698]
MDEAVFYISQGSPSAATSTGKSHQDNATTAMITSMHSSHQYSAFRQATCPTNGAIMTGSPSSGERLFVSCPGKALMHVYSYGKEAPDQRIPLPEQLACLTLVPHPLMGSTTSGTLATGNQKPQFRLPWLLVGGGISGRLFVWELALGLLLSVREAHYQSVTCLQASKSGSYLTSAGKDGRLLVWRTADLVGLYTSNLATSASVDDFDESRMQKPVWSVSDHTLPVTAVCVTESALLNDTKVFTASLDGTMRVYDLLTAKLLTTFVVSAEGVRCMVLDPSLRAVYAGLADGQVRRIPLYQANTATNIVEAVGGCGKIITLDTDPSMNHTFALSAQQQTATQKVAVTCLAISMDGTFLVSGDSQGGVYISDVATRQIIKTLKPLHGAISQLQVFRATASDNSGELVSKNDKAHRLIPQLKRVIASADVREHDIVMEVPSLDDEEETFEAWLDEVKRQELAFKNLTAVDSEVKVTGENNGKVADLESQVKKMTQAYTELRKMHEELFNEHSKLLKEGK